MPSTSVAGSTHARNRLQANRPLEFRFEVMIRCHGVSNGICHRERALGGSPPNRDTYSLASAPGAWAILSATPARLARRAYAGGPLAWTALDLRSGDQHRISWQRRLKRSGAGSGREPAPVVGELSHSISRFENRAQNPCLVAVTFSPAIRMVLVTLRFGSCHRVDKILAIPDGQFLLLHLLQLGNVQPPAHGARTRGTAGRTRAPIWVGPEGVNHLTRSGSNPQRDPHTGLVIAFEGLALAA